MPFHLLNCVIALSLLLAVSAPLAFAQSQALNGQIEGTVLDQVNAAVPDALITVTNLETGATRTVTTDESEGRTVSNFSYYAHARRRQLRENGSRDRDSLSG
jgi:hypothetical protein